MGKTKKNDNVKGSTPNVRNSGYRKKQTEKRYIAFCNLFLDKYFALAWVGSCNHNSTSTIIRCMPCYAIRNQDTKSHLFDL